MKCKRCTRVVTPETIAPGVTLEMDDNFPTVVVGTVTLTARCPVCRLVMFERVKKIRQHMLAELDGKHSCPRSNDPTKPDLKTAGMRNLIMTPDKLYSWKIGLQEVARCQKHETPMIQKDLERGGCMVCVSDAKKTIKAYEEWEKTRPEQTEWPLQVNVGASEVGEAVEKKTRTTFKVKVEYRVVCTCGGFDSLKTFEKVF